MMRRHVPDTASAAVPQGGLSLHIERLVIDQSLLSGGGTALLHLALQRELGCLLQQSGAGAQLQGGAVPALAAPSFNATPALRPAELGRRVAASLHQTIKGGR